MESRGLKRQLQAFAFSFIKSRRFGHIDVATGNAAPINCEASKLCLVKKSDPQDVRAIPVTHAKSSTEKCGLCTKLVTANACSALPFFIIEIDRGIWNFILVSPSLRTATALVSTLFTFFRSCLVFSIKSELLLYTRTFPIRHSMALELHRSVHPAIASL